MAFAIQGAWSDWVKRNLIAAETAVEEINAAGGVNGMPFKTIHSRGYLLFRTGTPV
jgi:ABC-type branched-subunit amino acid transport system substrate-binding protein